EMVIEPQFDNAKGFHRGLAVVGKDKQWIYIDKSGNTVEMPPSDKLYDFNKEGVAFIKVGDLVGLINTKGEEVLKPTYSEIKPFEHGIVKVKKDIRWGVVSPVGRLVNQPEYDELDFSVTNAFIGRKGTAFGIVSTSGQFIPIEGVTKL